MKLLSGACRMAGTHRCVSAVICISRHTLGMDQLEARFHLSKGGSELCHGRCCVHGWDGIRLRARRCSMSLYQEASGPAPSVTLCLFNGCRSVGERDSLIPYLIMIPTLYIPVTCATQQHFRVMVHANG
jgi:hypothetical protein